MLKQGSLFTEIARRSNPTKPAKPPRSSAREEIVASVAHPVLSSGDTIIETRVMSVEVAEQFNRIVDGCPSIDPLTVIKSAVHRGQWKLVTLKSPSNPCHSLCRIEFNPLYRPASTVAGIHVLCAGCEWFALCGLHPDHPSCEYTRKEGSHD